MLPPPPRNFVFSVSSLIRLAYKQEGPVWNFIAPPPPSRDMHLGGGSEKQGAQCQTHVGRNEYRVCPSPLRCPPPPSLNLEFLSTSPFLPSPPPPPAPHFYLLNFFLAIISNAVCTGLSSVLVVINYRDPDTYYSDPSLSPQPVSPPPPPFQSHRSPVLELPAGMLRRVSLSTSLAFPPPVLLLP